MSTSIRLPRRQIIRATGGLAGILALGKAPAFAQAQPKKLGLANVTGVPEAGALVLDWLCKEVTTRSKGELEFEFHGATLLTKELEIMNALKAGNIAMGTPGGATATVFPEIGALLSALNTNVRLVGQ